MRIRKVFFANGTVLEITASRCGFKKMVDFARGYEGRLTWFRDCPAWRSACELYRLRSLAGDI